MTELLLAAAQVVIGAFAWVWPRQNRPTKSDAVRGISVREIKDCSSPDFERAIRLFTARFRADERQGVTEDVIASWLAAGKGWVRGVIATRQCLYGAFTDDGEAVGILMFVYYPLRRRALIQYLAVRKGLLSRYGKHVAQRLLCSAERFLTSRLIRCSEIVLELASLSRARRFAGLSRARGITLYRLEYEYRAPSLAVGEPPRPMMLCFGKLLGRRKATTQVSRGDCIALLRFMYLTAYADSFDTEPEHAAEYRQLLQKLFDEEQRALDARKSIPVARLNANPTPIIRKQSA